MLLSKYLPKCLKDRAGVSLQGQSLKHIQDLISELDKYLCRKITGIQHVTPSLLTAFLKKRTAGLSKTSFKMRVWVFRRFFGYLTMRGVLKTNPAKALRYPRINSRAKLPQYLSRVQLSRLIACALSGSEEGYRAERDMLIVLLLCCLGLRMHEIPMIRKSDYSEEFRYLNVRGKGGVVRHLPLSRSLCGLVSGFINKYSSKESTYMFMSRQKRPICKRLVEIAVKEAAVRVGLPRDVSAKTLRHTFATYMAENNPLIVCKTFLGHGNLASSRVYAHLSFKRFGAVMERHPEYWKGARYHE